MLEMLSDGKVPIPPHRDIFAMQCDCNHSCTLSVLACIAKKDHALSPDHFSLRSRLRKGMMPNNVLSDKDVARSNIAGYYANMRVRHCPCPPVPLPPSRRTGVYQEASRQLAPSRLGADHSIVRAAPRLYPPCATSDNPAYVHQAGLDRTGFTLVPVNGR
jgi:hypothetical protein